MRRGETSRVVLVTGSSSGIGRACADRLAREGWRVYGGSRSRPTSDAGVAWTPLILDVTSGESVTAAVTQIEMETRRIDALVLAAGMSVAGSIEDVSTDEAKLQFDTNYHGVVRVVQASLPLMRRQQSGRIVIIGSIAGLIALPFMGHYSAAKFALEGLTQALRIEVAPFGIEATIVHPGDIRTAFGANQVEGAATGETSAYHARFRTAIEAYDAAMQAARPPDVIAEAVARVLARRRLPPRVIAGQLIERAGVGAKALMPLWFEGMLKSYYKI